MLPNLPFLRRAPSHPSPFSNIENIYNGQSSKPLIKLQYVQTSVHPHLLYLHPADPLCQATHAVPNPPPRSPAEPGH